VCVDHTSWCHVILDTWLHTNHCSCLHHLLVYLLQLPAGVPQQQQQQQESGAGVVDRQTLLQAQSEPVTSSTWHHASQGNPAASDKQAQQAQQAQPAQREAPHNVEAWLDGAPAQPRTAVHPAAVADADGKSQVNKCFCEVLNTALAIPVEHKKKVCACSSHHKRCI